MKKYSRIAVVAHALLWVATTASAQEAKLPRIGFVAGAGGYPKMAVTNQAFFDGLAASDFVDGRTVRVVFRTAEGDMSQMPRLVNEVLAAGVDYVVVSTSPGCAAAKNATTTVPILCISVQEDPVAVGHATTLAQGKGNLVGVHSYLPDGVTQQLAMLKTLKPGLHTLGVLFNPRNDTHVRVLSEWQSAVAKEGLVIVPLAASASTDLDEALSRAKASKGQLAIGLLGADTYAMRKEIAEIATSRDLPIVMDTPGGYTQLGGVATIGVDIVPLYRKSAVEQMVPMLKGIPPSQIAWIGPTKVTMNVNNEVAKRFGLQQIR